MRTSVGITLTELMVSTILVGVSLAAIGELVVLNTFASTKLTNKIDGQVGCSRAMRRICEDVRHARMIGNIYALTEKQKYPDYTEESDDPSVIAPTGGFPTAPWPTTLPYILSSDTLIIQRPTFFEDLDSNHKEKDNPLNGFPLKLAPGAVQVSPPVPKTARECVDTTIYHLVPDTAATGQFLLQVARFGGKAAGAQQSNDLNPPQTILKGIVGPMDPSNPGVPAIFGYLRTPKETSPLLLPQPGDMASICGISINIEVKSPNQNQGANQEIVASHADAYVKNSRFIELANE